MATAILKRVAGDRRIAAMIVEFDQRCRPDQSLERCLVNRLGALDEMNGRIDVGRHVREHRESRALPAAVFKGVGGRELVLETEPTLAVLDWNGKINDVGHVLSPC